MNKGQRVLVPRFVWVFAQGCQFFLVLNLKLFVFHVEFGRIQHELDQKLRIVFERIVSHGLKTFRLPAEQQPVCPADVLFTRDWPGSTAFARLRYRSPLAVARFRHAAPSQQNCPVNAVVYQSAVKSLTVFAEPVTPLSRTDSC